MSTIRLCARILFATPAVTNPTEGDRKRPYSCPPKAASRGTHFATAFQDNLNAARWTEEAGLFTCYQLVLAMPGETKKTIDETIDFVKNIIAPRAEPPHTLLSTNYIQALPGTPVYELARQKGLIGNRLEDEEAYLIRISDVNANDDTKFELYGGRLFHSGPLASQNP